MVRAATPLQKSASNNVRSQPKPIKTRVPKHEQEKVLHQMELLEKKEGFNIARQKIDKDLHLHLTKLSKHYFASLDFDQLINSTPYWSTLCKSEQEKYCVKFTKNPECPTIPIPVQRYLDGEKEAEDEVKRVFLTHKLEILSSTEQWTLVDKYRRCGGSLKEFVKNTMELNVPTLVIEMFFKQKGGNPPTRAVLTPVPLSMDI